MVWRSQDPLLQRSVAVKLIHPRLADDPAFAQALAEEARRVAALSVPGIARLLDTGEQDGVTYLVREYAPGSCLRERLDRAGPASPSEAVRIGVAALGALAEAHDRGVLHLALDPDDVIVGEDGRVCLIDFGIGAAVAASRPTEAAALLDDEHLAPEQLAGTEPDARTDVYAIASLLFELLTGEPPRGRTAAAGRPARRPPDARPRPGARARPRSRHVGSPTRAPSRTRSRVRSTSSWSTCPTRDAPPTCSPGSACRSSWWDSRSPRSSLGLWMGKLEVGGPLGIRAAPDEPAAVETPPTVIRPASVGAIDPFGDGDELSSNAAARRRRRSPDRVAVGELLRRRARQARVRAPARSRRVGTRSWGCGCGRRIPGSGSASRSATTPTRSSTRSAARSPRRPCPASPCEAPAGTCSCGSPRSCRSTTASAPRWPRCG